MISKKLFSGLLKEVEGFDTRRELVIKGSRDVLKTSKKVIYSLHRSHMKQAEQLLRDARKGLASLKKEGIKYPALLYQGSLLDAEEEFVEASLYFAFVKEKSLPDARELDVSAETYLAGLCDLTGELVRAGINASINGQFEKTIAMRDFVSAVYDELLMFNFRNSSLRRKFDAVKYGVEKLDDVVLKLKLREKN